MKDSRETVRVRFPDGWETEALTNPLPNGFNALTAEVHGIWIRVGEASDACVEHTVAAKEPIRF